MIMILSAIASLLASRPRRMRLVKSGPLTNREIERLNAFLLSDGGPRVLLRDRDASYGRGFRDRVRVMGINEVVTAPRSPWQNPYVERLIGSIRRECLDHIIIFDEHHLRGVLSSYFRYLTKPERISRSRGERSASSLRTSRCMTSLVTEPTRQCRRDNPSHLRATTLLKCAGFHNFHAWRSSRSCLPICGAADENRRPRSAATRVPDQIHFCARTSSESPLDANE